MFESAKVKSYREKVNSLNSSFDFAQKQCEAERKALRIAKRRKEAAEEALSRVQIIAEHIQSLAHHRIASLCSEALSACFGERAYQLKIMFERKRQQTEAWLRFERNGQILDPLSASGGGMVDVAAFALRLAAICLSRPQRRKCLILDEPFRFVSKQYWPALQEMLEMMSDKLDVQFIIVTHIKELEIGKVVELGDLGR